MELIPSKYVPIPRNSWQFTWNKYDVLTTNSPWILVIAVGKFLYVKNYSQYTLSTRRSISGDNSANFPILIPQTIRNLKKLCLVFWREPLSTDLFSIHSLYIQKMALRDCNSTRLCATKTIQEMNRLNEKNLRAAPYNPSMGDINDITASTKEKKHEWHGTISGILRNVLLHSTLPTWNIHYTHY